MGPKMSKAAFVAVLLDAGFVNKLLLSPGVQMIAVYTIIR